MTSLHELQYRFAEHVAGEPGDWPAQTFRAGAISAADRFEVYRNNVRASLCDALADVYPVLRRLVGEEFFRQTARGYLRACPPLTGNLHDFGGRLAERLASDPALADFPYLADVARLEWAWHCVYHADDRMPEIDLADLAGITDAQWRGALFEPHPAVALVASAYPILHIWQANQDGAPPDECVSLEEGGDFVLVARRGMECRFERLERGAFELLAAFAEGCTLEEACRRAEAADPDFLLASTLPAMIRDGVLVALHLPPAGIPDFMETEHGRTH